MASRKMMIDRKGPKKHKVLKRILLTLLILVLALAVALGIYLSRSHAGDETAQNVIASPSADVTVQQDNSTLAFVPDGNITAGIVIYPGIKIHADAYAVLANSLAARGYLCVLVNMPLNVALLNPDAAVSVIQQWPDVQNWYIGGHSMGALAAQQCASKHSGLFSGLIVLASQIKYDFSDSSLPVLAIYATEDGICTPERLAAVKTPEPKNYTKVIINGGCHGYFGNYGAQFMDGTPTITREYQQQQTLNAILTFLAGASA